jgi:hypothetical protein
MASEDLTDLEASVLLEDSIDLDKRKLSGVISAFNDILRNIGSGHRFIVKGKGLPNATDRAYFRIFWDNLEDDAEHYRDTRLERFEIADENKSELRMLRVYFNTESNDLVFRRICRFWKETKTLHQEGYDIATIGRNRLTVYNRAIF